jgi:SDR family mycofactocin-dependent oxidoreductase
MTFDASTHTRRLDGKVALITGAGHGQGRCHAAVLAEHGADIVGLDLGTATIEPAFRYAMGTNEELAETASMVEARGRRCVTGVADVRDAVALKEAVDDAVAEFGRLDIVVANHGVLEIDYFEDIDEAMWDAVLDINLKGVWNVVRFATPHLKANHGGSIVITSSTAGIRGHVGYAHYVASKHGVVGLAKALANELAPWRIRVNTVHPTSIANDHSGYQADSFMITRGAMPRNPKVLEDPQMAVAATNRLPDYRRPYDDTTPVSFIEPIDVSYAVLFLAADESRYVTGIQLPVDAGNTLKP